MSLQFIQQATRDKQSYSLNASQIIESIKAGDLEIILQLLEYADKCFKDQNENVLKKFLVLLLIKDCVVIKSGKLINALAGNKSLLGSFEQICMFDAGNDDPNRGKNYFQNQDPDLSAQFVRLCLELVNHLGKTYPLDARKNSTKFKILLDNLLSQHVNFPPPSELMQPFKKISPVKNSKTSEEQFPPKHDNQFQSQQSQQQFQGQSQLSSQERDQIMIKINEIKKSINDDMEMISDTLRENLSGGDQAYVHDVLDTFSQSLVQTSQDFKKQIDQLSKFQHALDSRDLKELQNYLEFSELYPQLHDQFLQERSTPQAFEKLKQKVLTLIDKTIHVDQTPQPPQDQFQDQKQQFKNEQQQQKEKVEQELRQQQIQEQQLKDQQLREQQLKEQQLKEQQLREQQIKEQQLKEQQLREQQLREQQLKEQQILREAQQRQEQEMRDRQEQEQIRLKEIQEERKRKEEQEKQIASQHAKHSEYMRQKQQEQEELDQQRRIQQQSFQNWGDVNDEQISIQKPNLNIVSEQRSMKFLQASQRQNDQQSQIVDLDTFGRHISQKQPSLEKKHEDNFDKNFDALSNTSLSALGSFPANQQVDLPLKKHLGRILYQNESFYNWFQNINEKDLRLWKVHNIRQRGVLYENSLIQIGAICELQFNFIQQKSYLILNFYFGNKTDQEFKNVKIKYFGEQNSVNIWIKPEKIESEIPAGVQMKQSLIFQFTDPSYMAPYSIMQFQSQDSQIEVEFNVPCSLVRFIDFKDIDERIFRAKWRQLKLQVIRTPVLNLNTRVVKSGQDFKKYFPSLIEIQTYQKFMEQRIDMSREIKDRKYINYKLGGLFDFLDESETYMLKIIIYPNMKFCVQLIAPFEKKLIAENLLQTIMFIFSV